MAPRDGLFGATSSGAQRRTLQVLDSFCAELGILHALSVSRSIVSVEAVSSFLHTVPMQSVNLLAWNANRACLEQYFS